MLAIKDPAIKLFGRKIQLSDDWEPSVIAADDSGTTDTDTVDAQHGVGEPVKENSAGRAIESKLADDEDDMAIDTDDSSNREGAVNPKTLSLDEETTQPEETETNNSEKTLKKPDKLLPCPRCKSMETKFCYYNNYNVNQPRHFCKTCQRYWTAGGTMRNVPVGAGRRKSKNSSSYYRHISISEALEAARMEVPNGTHQPKFITHNGRVFSFELDPPSSDSVGLKKFENRGRSSANEKVSDTCDNNSSRVSSTAVQESEGRKHPPEAQTQKINGFPSQIPCLAGVPWPYVWNSSVSAGSFFPPLSFYPAVPWPWTTPWFSPNESLSSVSNLGKHSREEQDNISSKEECLKQRKGRVLVPKTLRIDDPSEAAKSSIWATLGIKNESLSGGSLFKTFQSKGHEKVVHIAETSPVLQANPAAFSRSLVFHESS